MRLIIAADDELYGLASLAGKLGSAAKLLARLADARRADPGDAEVAGRYALASMAILPSVGIEFAAHARFTAAVEAMSDTLSLDPGNWLARYSRARLRALIPSSYGTYSMQLSSELTSARDDLDQLLDRQAGCAPQPYFASAHALAAVIDQLSGDPDRAGRPSLLDALSACPRRPVRLPALGAVLCEPLATLYSGSADKLRTVIGEVMSALYGDQTAVAAVRHQPVRR